MNKLHQLIEESNKETALLYPSGQNHKGTKFGWFDIKGFKIYAVSKDHANNIYQQCKIDAE